MELVLSNGTDRDANSAFWNVEGFDIEHDRQLQGKRPDDIVYAFTLDLSMTPYLVEHDTTPEAFDITANLFEELDGIVVYDARKLERKSKNASPAPAVLDRYAWRQHCRGLFQIPIAA